MAAGVAADDVTACAEIPDAGPADEPRPADAVRGDEEPAAHAASFEKIRCQVRTRAAIIERDAQGAWIERATVDRVLQGVEMRCEHLWRDFIGTGGGALKTAAILAALRHHVV